MKKNIINLICFVFLTSLATASLVSANTAVSGTLSQTATGTAPAIRVDQLSVKVEFQKLEQELNNSIQDGPRVLNAIREFEKDVDPVLTAINSAVKSSLDPNGQWGDIFDFLDANEWAAPLFQYAAGNERDDEPVYVTVNRELRSGIQSEKTVTWVRNMRRAMERLPRYEGLTFRGTRLTAEKIQQYYPLGQQAVDKAFISTSIQNSTAAKFAKANVQQSPPDGKIAVVFVIKGKTGRPVSSFAYMHSHEQEVLFANGTVMFTLAQSPMFFDSYLGITQIILMEER